MSDVIAIGLAGLFLISGSAKLVRVSAFRHALADTYGMPGRLAMLASIGVPVAEISVAVTLLLGPLRTAGFVLAVCLLIGIAGVVVTAWVRGASGECGCMGVLSSERLSFSTVLRLLAIISVVGIAGASRAGWLAFDDLGVRDSNIGAILSVLGVAVLMLIVAAAVNTFGRFVRHWGWLWTS